jgi:hypothetical protein
MSGYAMTLILRQSTREREGKFGMVKTARTKEDYDKEVKCILSNVAGNKNAARVEAVFTAKLAQGKLSS